MPDHHVYPLNDLRDHDTETYNCWCKPEIEEYENGSLVMHRAMDGREKYETGERKYS